MINSISPQQITNIQINSLLKKLNKNFIDHIKIILKNISEVYILTLEDNFYFYQDTCVPLIQNLRKIPESCGKRICKIAYGFNFVMTLSENGHLLCWGQNNFGQLGNETIINRFEPGTIQNLDTKRMIDVCCGHLHTLALAESGILYSWGSNYAGQIGNKSNSDKLQPFKIEIQNFHKVKCIACGFAHSMIITEHGDVFGWGLNENNQLGLNNMENQHSPQKIETDQKFKVVSCGKVHTLLLSQEGDIFSFGANDCGQLGLDDMRRNIPTPTKIQSRYKFIQIFASWDRNISLAISETRECFGWGDCGDRKIIHPLRTTVKLLPESFVLNSSTQLISKHRQTITTYLKNTFANEMTVELPFTSTHLELIPERNDDNEHFRERMQFNFENFVINYQ